MRVCVEVLLRGVEDRAGMLRFLLDSAARSTEVAEVSVWSGLADLAEEMQMRVRAVRKGLDVEALDTEVEERG